MKKYFGFTLIASLLTTGCASLEPSASDVGAKNMSHIHMGHVSTAWSDTPSGKGFLPTAMAEVEIAVIHADLSAKKLDDLAWMKTHTHHVIHAIDPAREPKGPGLGYGVLKAGSGALKHINLAADSVDASVNVKVHTEHVATSTQNTLERANEMLALSEEILTAKEATTAAPLVRKMNTLAMQLAQGFDANQDGKITWQKGEGGLNAANKHMGIMAKGEKMASASTY